MNRPETRNFRMCKEIKQSHTLALTSYLTELPDGVLVRWKVQRMIKDMSCGPWIGKKKDFDL